MQAVDKSNINGKQSMHEHISRINRGNSERRERLGGSLSGVGATSTVARSW